MSVTTAFIFASLLAPGDAPKEDFVQKELNALQGTWVIEANLQEGVETPELLRETKRYIIKDDLYSVSLGAEPYLKLRIKLDPAKSPKTIDLVTLKSDTVMVKGIYEIKGDTLKICAPVKSKDRPKEMKSEAGSKSAIIVYKRVKE